MFNDSSHVTYPDSPYFHSVYDNLIDRDIQRLVAALCTHGELNRNQKRLLNELLVPFRLLAMRSAHEVVPRTASGSSLRKLPKDLCRLVRGMFV
jgi:hypothetical protein